ncbi:hypothetical protein Anas_13733, partial [Armadillidium nasatum]
VRYRLNGSEFDVSYVAKLNPLRPVSPFTEVLEEMFGRETDIFSTIVGGMNEQLEKLDLPPLKNPKLFSRSLEKSKEAFLLENLKVQGFEVYDRRKGMDLNHCTLALKELGRFHASSLLYEETLHPKTIPESFDYFKVLFIIVNGMNKQLHELNLPHITTPKLYARDLEIGREVFIAENLRAQGFLTIDKRKVMDFDHTVLVLNELGRFHASSLLYEETLHPKSIEESFNLKDPRFDYNHESFKVFDKFNISMVRILSEILMKEGPKYEKFVSWIHDHLERLTGYFFDKNVPVKPFNLLLHGDCWTNNFLFRYDEKSMPVEIRFIDFQWARKGSPGRDLNYFFYMCLDGKLRTEKMPQMLSIYYQSFCEVLKRAGKPIPFSYEDLVLEVKNRKIFGLVSIMMLMTGVQVDHVFDSLFEEDPDSHMKMKNLTVNAMNDSKCPLKERIFSIFDELIDDKLFD